MKQDFKKVSQFYQRFCFSILKINVKGLFDILFLNPSLASPCYPHISVVSPNQRFLPFKNEAYLHFSMNKTK